jgi:hypothetical protein
MTKGFRFPALDTLVAGAQASAGLSDFGGEDFREGLGRFLEALGEVSLNEAVAAGLVAQMKQRLVNRLEVEAWRQAHPEVAAVKVGPSLSITGLPRTGTTALANILSLEDRFRRLRSWEQSKPVPPPVFGEDDEDPRRLAALAAQERMKREQPEMMALHLWDADTTEEDVELLGMNFRSQQFTLPVFGYHAWWREADLGETFAYHKRVIQHLQSRRPPDRWLFKAPAHCYHLEAFLAAYPDAKVIMTHRDPAKAVPSAISFVSAMMPKGIEVDPLTRGPMNAEHLRVGVERAIQARKRLGEERFFDLHHREFVTDPFGSLERIYRFLGLELTARTRARMQAWHAENRSGSHGAHRYTPEQFGLRAEQLRADYDFYIERFDVPLEG